MSTMIGIAAAVEILARVFRHYQPDDETKRLIYDLTGDIGDSELVDGARSLCATESRQPHNMVAALRAAAQNIRERRYAETAAAEAKAEAGKYITYWERSLEERLEIDEARNECMRVVRGLGIDLRALEAAATAPPGDADAAGDDYKWWED